MKYYVGTDENSYRWFWDELRLRVHVEGDDNASGGYHCGSFKESLHVVREDAGFDCTFRRDHDEVLS